MMIKYKDGYKFLGNLSPEIYNDIKQYFPLIEAYDTVDDGLACGISTQYPEEVQSIYDIIVMSWYTTPEKYKMIFKYIYELKNSYDMD
jgi:hypothetical protein